jgi:tol-pal system protein YbgF
MREDRDDEENLLTAAMRAAFVPVELRPGFAERVTRAWMTERSAAVRTRLWRGFPLVLGTLTVAIAAAAWLWLSATKVASPVRPAPLPAAAPSHAPRSPDRPAKESDVETLPTPDALYAAADKRVGAQRWADARRLYEAFIDRYPTDRRAARAEYEIGDAYAAERRFKEAIGAYTKVIDRFPESDVAADAMYKTGVAFYALKYCSDAKSYFQELLARYPGTSWKSDAARRLVDLGHERGDRAVCRD